MIDIVLSLKQLNYGVISIWDIHLYAERKQENSMGGNWWNKKLKAEV